jgi:hyaluronan synthase
MHAYRTVREINSHAAIPWVWLFAFTFLAIQMLLCFAERPFQTTAAQMASLDLLSLVVNVPVYNEDPTALRECLLSLLTQTRKPALIHVVDDGSKISYSETESWFRTETARYGVMCAWDRQPNAGKRSAQGRTIATFPWADIVLTVDSDAILDPNAIREGLKPFVNPRIHSVAGIIMVANRSVNLLTRMTDLWFVIGQTVDRSAFSVARGVLVNSGALAFYRGELLRKYRDGYLAEWFFGRRVEFSDDSLLTIYALIEGQAVQQPTSFAFTLMPERYSHHRRQYIRWMRGAFIRSFWRFRYLPLTSVAYWLHFLSWVQMFLATFTFAVLFVWTPIHVPEVIPVFLMIPLLVGYGQGLRYFIIRRSDMTFGAQFRMWLLTPVVSLYSFFILRFIRFYSIATCLKTGWGTRENVEVPMHPGEMVAVRPAAQATPFPEPRRELTAMSSTRTARPAGGQHWELITTSPARSVPPAGGQHWELITTSPARTVPPAGGRHRELITTSPTRTARPAGGRHRRTLPARQSAMTRPFMVRK